MSRCEDRGCSWPWLGQMSMAVLKRMMGMGMGRNVLGGEDRSLSSIT